MAFEHVDRSRLHAGEVNCLLLLQVFGTTQPESSAPSGPQSHFAVFSDVRKFLPVESFVAASGAASALRYECDLTQCGRLAPPRRALFSKRWEFCFPEKISAKRQLSADGAADLRRRAAPSARTRHGGEDIDAAEEIRLRAKRAPSTCKT